ncbi:hypothetical protein [Fibrella aquatilis]|uniref:Uncharacterized protein n=1 Tax=Fibrella aquatilis TaxID=2817059 RepID=A0A939GBW0_9BACT|nr:hypothetical protein [Fibrella aquatilis]MBO0934005.1 hypothetical protein [Fibrella aquatilis]
MTERLIHFFLKYPFDFISNIFLLLPVFIGIYRQKYLTTVLKLFLIVFLVRFVEESVLIYAALANGTNIAEQKVIMLIDVLLISIPYLLLFRHKPSYLKITYFIGGIVEIALLVYVIFYEQTGLSGSVMRLFIIVISLLYYNLILAENKIKNILHHSMFWINAGMLIYAMGTFMTFLFIDYLYDPSKVSDQNFDIFWNLSQLIVCIQCILTAVGMYFAKEERTNQLSRI